MSMRIQPLARHDLDEADRIFRLAFGTFLGLPDPLRFAGDSDLLRPRWRASPESVLGAYEDGRLVGSNVLTRWGRFGFFGPLTVLPEHWDRGVGQALLDATMQLFDEWGTELVSLFTFPQSTMHVHVYQKHGFWPQTLTAVMAVPVDGRAMPDGASCHADFAPAERPAALEECRALADAILPGLDPTSEVVALEQQGLGDTVLLHEGGVLSAFAVCHAGPGSEAGSETVYVKFGAVRPGRNPAAAFDRLLNACDAYAAQRGMKTLLAGVNTARIEAYRLMLARGFRAVIQGVAMQRPHAPGTLRAGCYVLDDWR